MDETDWKAGASLHVQTALRRLHAEHRRKASAPQRAAAGAIDMLGRPLASGVLAVAVAAWTSGNLAASRWGFEPLDPPPFAWLQGFATLASLFAVLLVLAAQRHEVELNRQRESLSLELSMLAEQKTAKIIQLLEELRRDGPQIHDRVDRAAESMSEPVDAQAMMEKVQSAPVERPPKEGT